MQELPKKAPKPNSKGKTRKPRRFSVGTRASDAEEKDLEAARRAMLEKANAAGNTNNPTEPAEVETTFEAEGPLGLAWHHYMDERGRSVACIKALKPGSAAEQARTLRNGMLLGYVNGRWVKGVDYFDQIKLVRETRPVVLGFCGNASLNSQLQAALGNSVTKESLKSDGGGSSSGKSPAAKSPARGASGDASTASRRDPGGSEGEGAGGGGDGGLEAKVGRMQEQIDSLTAEVAELRAMVQTLMPKKPPAEGIPKR